MVVGQIEEVYATDSCLTDGEPDVTKINLSSGLPAQLMNIELLGSPLGKHITLEER